MYALVIFLIALALGAANPIGPTTTVSSEPSRDELIRTAIDRNVQWLLRGIRDGSLGGDDLPRAVVALFLAEPGFFTPEHTIRRELRDNLTHSLPKTRHQKIRFDLITSEWLALHVQALLVSCMDPRNFFAHDLLSELWNRLPSSVMLALCNAGAATRRDFPFEPNTLTDEVKFTTMAIDCLESRSPWKASEIMLEDLPISKRSGYSFYPSPLTTEGLQTLIERRDDTNSRLLTEIAAAMQTLMYRNRLQVSDLPSAVDFLLRSQDDDGSWGQSAENSLFILPVLSNKSFLNISKEHCPANSDDDLLVNIPTKDYRMPVIVIKDDSYILRLITIHWPYGLGTLYDSLENQRNWDRYQAVYVNGTDGKPYLQSLLGKENNPETGYSWRLYVQSTYPEVTKTLVTESHADIEIRRDRKYTLWYTRQ